MVVDSDMQMGMLDNSAFPVQRRILDAAAAIPGVKGAGTIDSLPLGGGGGYNGQSIARELPICAVQTA